MRHVCVLTRLTWIFQPSQKTSHRNRSSVFYDDPHAAHWLISESCVYGKERDMVYLKPTRIHWFRSLGYRESRCISIFVFVGVSISDYKTETCFWLVNSVSIDPKSHQLVWKFLVLYLINIECRLHDSKHTFHDL